jgi:hypothetical protein
VKLALARLRRRLKGTLSRLSMQIFDAQGPGAAFARKPALHGMALTKLGTGVFLEPADHPRSGDREPTGKGAIMATVTKTAPGWRHLDRELRKHG